MRARTPRQQAQVFIKGHRIGGHDDTMDAHVYHKLEKFFTDTTHNFPMNKDHRFDEL